MKRLSRVLPKLTQRALRGRSSYELALRRDWPQVVGGELDGWLRPARLHAPGSAAVGGTRQGQRGQGAVLEVYVQRVFLLEIQQSSPDILQAINRYFGFDLVESLRIKQVSQPFAPRSQPEVQTQKRDPAEALAAVDLSSLPNTSIQDPELAARLARLAAIIKQKSTSS